MTRGSMLHGLFVTGTGTGIGKTFVTRGLARALVRRGKAVAALKPVETGCDPDPVDALALADACRRPELARSMGFYRARAPLAPYAATLAGESPPPDVATLAGLVAHAGRGCDLALVEGAGGLFVPLTRHEDLAHLAAELGLPLLIVAPDGLGVLSHARSALMAARHCGLPLEMAALVLVRAPATQGDPSRRWNAAILADLELPVVVFEHAPDDDDALADQSDQCGLTDLVLSQI